jgi:hypothetical protein
VAVTPGEVGTQQAIAYSLGQQAILTAWNVALGVVALGVTIGWGATRGLIRDRWAEARASRAHRP